MGPSSLEFFIVFFKYIAIDHADSQIGRGTTPFEAAALLREARRLLCAGGEG